MGIAKSASPGLLDPLAGVWVDPVSEGVPQGTNVKEFCSPRPAVSGPLLF